MSQDVLPKSVVLLGPTASGKTAWGLRLAEKFGGEIISADSRQIYKYMDIGTAKEPGAWRDGAYIASGIRHHLIDFLDPAKVFTAAEWREKAIAHLHTISQAHHLPLVVGGTGLYISTLVDNWEIPRIPPNPMLRQSLETKDPAELVHLLETFDLESAKRIDPRNIRRVIRALEVTILSGRKFSEQRVKGSMLGNFLLIGIDVPREVLIERIDRRIDQMMERGLPEEVARLHARGYSWDLPSMSGIGYREFREYSEGKKSLALVAAQLKQDTRQYARRQMTWFRKQEGIHWCRDYAEAEALVQKFL